MASIDLNINTAVSTVLTDETIEEFRAAMRGEVLTPQSDHYDEVRLIWNGLMHDRHPAIIARCTGVADVITALNFARENDLLLAVRGGGHNVAGSASCEGGIMIDLSLMAASCLRLCLPPRSYAATCGKIETVTGLPASPTPAASSSFFTPRPP